ncbi:MAG: hypothetical protein HY804_05435 [Nitrospinae bacterium]|nr:hypothetical protein [Nitrospinota bacterium]
MSSRPVKALIEDILEAIGKIDRYLAGMDKADFLADSKTVDSSRRSTQEFIKKISEMGKKRF